MSFPCKIRVGNRTLVNQRDFVDMEDSTPLFERGDFSGLRQRLGETGFLLVRGVLANKTVESAKNRLRAILFKKVRIYPALPSQSQLHHHFIAN
jgi:hypothetical protein